MGKRIYRDINIRGTVYPDANAAAAAHCVSPDTVRLAVRRGTQHRIGTGAVGAEPMPVRIRGQLFPSAKAAAAHFGITPHAIYKALGEGRVDDVANPPRYNGARSRSVTIGSLRFASMAQASRALGFSSGYVSQALRRPSVATRQRIVGAVMAIDARRGAR